MPIFKPWAILGVLAMVIGAYFAGGFIEAGRCNTRWKAKTEADMRKAVEEALSLEREQQGVINHAMQKQAADLASINTRLRADLVSLRDRADRAAATSQSARDACKGATGAELSRRDAEFLVWEAARADEIRAGLAACYQVIDGLKQ